MAKKAETPRAMRQVRHLRVRRKVIGVQERPRLAVFRSMKHIYAQVIDDTVGHTLVAVSDRELEIAGKGSKKPKTGVAKLAGKLIAQKALAAGISKVVFDRGGYQYHGRVKALADAAREGGLLF